MAPFHHWSLVARRLTCELREDLGAERVDEAVLGPGHVVEEELVDAAVEQGSCRCAAWAAEVGGHEDRVRDVVGPDVGGGDLELLDPFEVGHERGVEDVGAPLVVRARERLLLRRRPRDLRLHGDRLALAPSARGTPR